MELQTLIYLFVGASFALYIGIAIWAKAASTSDFYIAGGGVNPVVNGMATAADWMSAASFISLAGIVSLLGRDGTAYLMGWTGGYVLLAMLLAPYLRKFGKFTVPDFVGDRYYSDVARTVAVICVIFISFTYVAGQMRGVGIVFSRFLQVDINTGVVLGMAVVFVYAVLGGMKGITYTQVAQYCVLIVAYTIPAIFLSLQITGDFLPQVGFGGTIQFAFDNGVREIPAGTYVLHALDQSFKDLGFAIPYTEGRAGVWDTFLLTVALMAGTAGLPHVIVRFFTVPRVRDARVSAGWALLFISILYTVCPAVGAFGRLNLIKNLQNNDYAVWTRECTADDLANIQAAQRAGQDTARMPCRGQWFATWENSGLISWLDKNGDGKIQIANGGAFKGKAAYTGERGASGERLISNEAIATPAGQTIGNEVVVDRDIIVLANPEIAALPNWVIALIAAGGLAAALSTAAGLLLVISSSISHDLLGRVIYKDPETGQSKLTDAQELMAARGAAAVAILIAGYLGINPPGFVAQVVAFAFGLAAASFFPVIINGIFDKRMNKEGAIAGMAVGLTLTFVYIVLNVFVDPSGTYKVFSIEATGIGTIAMVIHFIVAYFVSRATAAPPQDIQDMVESIRIPRGAGEATAH